MKSMGVTIGDGSCVGNDACGTTGCQLAIMPAMETTLAIAKTPKAMV
jgi:hypothetical protein